MHIVVLHQVIDTSRADEADTLAQVEQISAHLKTLGHTVSRVAVATLGEVEAALTHHQPECVFNLVESFCGSDKFAYLVAGMLESLQVPFTGNAALPLQLASDKIKLKALLAASGVSVPRGLEAGADARYIVKSAQEHASLGIDGGSVVKGAAAAQKLIAAKTAQYGGKWLAEEYIEGRELNLSLLNTTDGYTLLPPAEILFENFPQGQPHIVDYAAKWDEESHAFHHTPRRFIQPTPAIEEIASKVWSAIELRGYARIDLRMDEDEKLWVIDINPNPCLSADAGFMAAAEQAGLTPVFIIQTILNSCHDARCRSPHIAA